MNIKKNNNNRIEFLDTAKGIGIILVIIGHVSTNVLINNWIYSFHMPLFFIISGYVSGKSTRVISIKKFLKRKAKRLLIPYFSFSILTYLYWVIIERNIRGDNTSIAKQFINIFIAQGGSNNYVFNVVMWFLPCLFVTEIIYYFINKNNNDKKLVYKVLILSSVIGYLISNYVNVRLPWTLDIVFTSLVFYGVGNLISDNDVNIISNYKIYYNNNIISIILFLCLTVISFWNKGVDMNNNIIPNYFIFYISAFLGIIFTISISKKIKLSFVKYLGEKSIIFMLLHEPIKRIVIKLVEILTKVKAEVLRNNIISILICSLIVIITIIPIIIIVDKYIPFIVGKSNKNKNIELTM